MSSISQAINQNTGSLGIIIAAGVSILIMFIVLRFFKTLFSLSFIGFLGSLFSYFIYDYLFARIPLIAALSFILCLTGFSKTSILGKVFALIGLLLSGYIIINQLGFI